MTVRGIHLLTLAGCTILAVAVFLLRREPPPPPAASDPKHAIPAGVAGVVTVDVARLRRLALDGALARRGRELPELGRIESLCGFDPTDRVDRLAVTFEDQPHSEADFGIAASGDLPAARILDCAETVTGQRGGRPVRSAVGSFSTVRDDSGATRGEIAARNGLVLLGAGTLLRRMIDAEDGRLHDVTDDSLHHELRKSVGPDGLAVLSWVRRPESPPLLGLSPIRALALRLDQAEDLVLFGVILCDDETVCSTIGSHIETADAIASLTRQDSVRTSLNGRELRVTMGLERDALGHVLDRWLEGS